MIALTATSAQSIHRFGPNYYGAGIPTEEFEYFAAPQHEGRQRQENWCWAACVQMVLNYHGLNVRQEQVVERIFGALVNLPGTPSQMLNALSGWAPNHRGGYSSIYAQYGVYSSADIINNLAAKWPIIVGLDNPYTTIAHAYVLTAIYYTVDISGEPVVDKVVLRDPYPNRPSRQIMHWQEFLARNPMFFKVWIQ